MALGGGAGPAHRARLGGGRPGRRRSAATTRPPKRLDISQSAVSQRAQAAGIVEGRRARELVTELTAALLAREGPHMNAETATQLVIVLLVRLRRSASIGGWAPFGRTVWPPVARGPARRGRRRRGGRRRARHERAEVATMIVVLAGRSPCSAVDRSPCGSSPPSTRRTRRGPGPALDRGRRRRAPGRRLDRRPRARRPSSPSLAAGLPEGVAVVLALKGLGRYPGAAQRPRTAGRRRAVHHRHLHQRALGRRLRRRVRPDPALLSAASPAKGCERSERARERASAASRRRRR